MVNKELSDELAYITRSFQRIKKQKPALMEILDTFKGLALKRAEIRVELKNIVNPHSFSMNTTVFAQGTPIFNNFPINNIDKEFSMVVKTLTPALAKAFKPLANSIALLNKKIDNKEIIIQECIDSILDDNPKKVKNLAKAIDTSPDIVQFILSQSIRIIFEHFSSKLGISLDITAWTQGYCPVCGSFPDISFLRAGNSEKEKSEFLKAHGGQFWLHCSQCSHEWRIKRSLCAYCGSEDKKSLQYFSVENSNKERVYTCNECKKYIVAIDEREDIEPNHPEATVVGVLPLYMIAKEKGFSPMAITPLHN